MLCYYSQLWCSAEIFSYWIDMPCCHVESIWCATVQCCYAMLSCCAVRISWDATMFCHAILLCRYVMLQVCITIVLTLCCCVILLCCTELWTTNTTWSEPACQRQKNMKLEHVPLPFEKDKKRTVSFRSLGASKRTVSDFKYVLSLDDVDRNPS